MVVCFDFRTCLLCWWFAVLVVPVRLFRLWCLIFVFAMFDGIVDLLVYFAIFVGWLYYLWCWFVVCVLCVVSFRFRWFCLF